MRWCFLKYEGADFEIANNWEPPERSQSDATLTTYKELASAREHAGKQIACMFVFDDDIPEGDFPLLWNISEDEARGIWVLYRHEVAALKHGPQP